MFLRLCDFGFPTKFGFCSVLISLQLRVPSHQCHVLNNPQSRDVLVTTLYEPSLISQADPSTNQQSRNTS